MTDLSAFMMRLIQTKIIEAQDNRGEVIKDAFEQHIEPQIRAKDRKIARLETIVSKQTEVAYLINTVNNEG